MAGSEIEQVIQLLARLPGLGPRSARRAVLHLLNHGDGALTRLANALTRLAATVRCCSACGNFDSLDPCAICVDSHRDPSVICVVEDVAGLWAMERVGVFRGRYHVLGGALSALDGIGPEDLHVDRLVARAAVPEVTEIILATGATVDGQTTAHYLADRLASCGVILSGLAHGVPMGGELDYLDDGTIAAALRARRPV
jgi:recombination protein RecR